MQDQDIRTPTFPSNVFPAGTGFFSSAQALGRSFNCALLILAGYSQAVVSLPLLERQVLRPLLRCCYLPSPTLFSRRFSGLQAETISCSSQSFAGPNHNRPQHYCE